MLCDIEDLDDQYEEIHTYHTWSKGTIILDTSDPITTPTSKVTSRKTSITPTISPPPTIKSILVPLSIKLVVVPQVSKPTTAPTRIPIIPKNTIFEYTYTETNELRGLGPIEYNIIKNFKNTKTSISLYDLINFYPIQKDFLKAVEFLLTKRPKETSQRKYPKVDKLKSPVDMIELIGKNITHAPHYFF